MKFSVFGGKKEEEISEKELNQLADQIAGSAEMEPAAAAQDAPDAYDEIRERTEELQARLEQLDSSCSALRSEMTQFDNRFGTMETNVRELLGLYELATKNQNPFFQAETSEGAPSPPGADSVQAAQKEESPLDTPIGRGPAQVPVESPILKGPWNENRLGLPREEEGVEVMGELTLEDLDNSPTTNMLVLRWIEYMMQKVGYTGLRSTLDYYVQIGWISNQAASRIMAFSTGIDLHGSGAKPPKKSTLTVREHLVSLYFVTRLKKDSVFDNIYLGVKDDVEKLGLSLSSESV